MDENDDSNNYCFDIVSTKSSSSSSLSSSSSSSITTITNNNSSNNINSEGIQVLQHGESLANGKLTRTFSAPLEQRNEWVRKINDVIEAYERSKKRSSIRRRRSNSEERMMLPPTSPMRRSRNGANSDYLDLNGLNIAC